MASVNNLHAAAYHGDIEIIKELVAKGDDLNTVNDAGLTPLMTVLLSDVGKKRKCKTIDYLLNSGADVNMLNKDGDSALHVAVKISTSRDVSRQFIKRLLDHGAVKNTYDESGKVASDIAYEIGNKKLGDYILLHKRNKKDGVMSSILSSLFPKSTSYNLFFADSDSEKSEKSENDYVITQSTSKVNKEMPPNVVLRIDNKVEPVYYVAQDIKRNHNNGCIENLTARKDLDSVESKSKPDQISTLSDIEQKYDNIRELGDNNTRILQEVDKTDHLKQQVIDKHCLKEITAIYNVKEQAENENIEGLTRVDIHELKKNICLVLKDNEKNDGNIEIPDKKVKTIKTSSSRQEVIQPTEDTVNITKKLINATERVNGEVVNSSETVSTRKEEVVGVVSTDDEFLHEIGLIKGKTKEAKNIATNEAIVVTKEDNNIREVVKHVQEKVDITEEISSTKENNNIMKEVEKTTNEIKSIADKEISSTKEGKYTIEDGDVKDEVICITDKINSIKKDNSIKEGVEDGTRENYNVTDFFKIENKEKDLQDIEITGTINDTTIGNNESKLRSDTQSKSQTINKEGELKLIDGKTSTSQITVKENSGEKYQRDSAQEIEEIYTSHYASRARNRHLSLSAIDISSYSTIYLHFSFNTNKSFVSRDNEGYRVHFID